jgi:hypothetical protein
LRFASHATPSLLGLRGKRGRLTVTAAAELVALDVLKAVGDAAAVGAQIDGRVVRRRLGELRQADDERLIEAARRVQVTHVLKICQTWSGGLANTRRRGHA